MRACVMVDSESVEDVIRELGELEKKGKGLEEFDMHGVTWVTLISHNYEGSADEEGEKGKKKIIYLVVSQN